MLKPGTIQGCGMYLGFHRRLFFVSPDFGNGPRWVDRSSTSLILFIYPVIWIAIIVREGFCCIFSLNYTEAAFRKVIAELIWNK